MNRYQLTERDIISTLALFEDRLPNPGTDVYTPSNEFISLDPVSLQKEGKRILNFLGVNNKTLLITTETLSGAAGTAEMGDKQSDIWYINLSTEILKSKNHTLCVMAHEICHKYLELYGLDVLNFERENEMRTELATIYTGLGLLTINGYEANTGYVECHDFIRTFCYLYVSRGMPKHIVLQNIPRDFKDIAITYIDRYSELEANIKLSNTIVETQKQVCQLHRLSIFAQQIIEHYGDFLEENRKFQNENVAILRLLHTPFKQIKTSFKIQDSYSAAQNDVSEAVATLREFIKKSYTTYNGLSRIEDVCQHKVVCPQCRYTLNKDIKSSVLSCPNCHFVFYWDATPFSVSEFDDLVISKEDVAKSHDNEVHNEENLFSKLKAFFKRKFNL